MEKYRKYALLALKVGLGSSLAICIAQALGLEYAVSAGTVTLLTLLGSKWETIKLAGTRLLTFAITVGLAWLLFTQTQSIWVAYGALLALVTFLAECFGWRSTLSVNAVVAVHLVMHPDLGLAAVWNEFLLVLIGIGIAIALNLFHSNFSHERHIIAHMRDTEHQLRTVLLDLASCLSGGGTQTAVQGDVGALEHKILHYGQDAKTYNDNTFSAHTKYYVTYFQMRYDQCRVLHNLSDMTAVLCRMPNHARSIAAYLRYLAGYIVEVNTPEEQLQKLYALRDGLRRGDAPTQWADFENRAVLYLYVAQLERLLRYKAAFVEGLDEAQRRRYWESHQVRRTPAGLK